MRGRRVIAVVVLLVLASLVSCTFLVSFDDRGDAACGPGACDGAFDGTFDGTFDGGEDADFEGTLGDDARLPGDDAGPDGSGEDAGGCSVLAEGDPCGKANACRAVSTCHDGVCTTHPLTDGTMCGPASDACHDPQTCHGGECGASAPTTDGAACGMAKDACHDVPVCTNGVCGASAAFAEGAVPTGGGANERCCSGKKVDTATDKSNCGVCGVVCTASQSCASLDGHYVCQGCVHNDECWSGCCSHDPTPDHCSPSECTSVACKANICPGGAHCVASTIDYCAY